jgi:hypothetical protein
MQLLQPKSWIQVKYPVTCEVKERVLTCFSAEGYLFLNTIQAKTYFKNWV